MDNEHVEGNQRDSEREEAKRDERENDELPDYEKNIIKKMKLNIFIENEEGAVILGRSFLIIDENAPKVDIQDMVDDAVKYQKEADIELEAKNMTQHND